VSLGDRLDEARAEMWRNHRLWDHLERNPGAQQEKLLRTLGGNRGEWRAVVERWEAMGLVARTPESGSHRLALSTRMADVVRGKCSACGTIVRGQKSALLKDRECPKCGKTVPLVILVGESRHGVKE
jgi:predicted RNA-binding Zn-ribbon protein involved in translation (DUF1610 family)